MKDRQVFRVPPVVGSLSAIEKLWTLIQCEVLHSQVVCGSTEWLYMSVC